jgi:hypothetical protein
VEGDKRISYAIKESRREQPIGIAAAATASEIVAGPNELIGFVNDDPRSLAVEPEVPFDGFGNLDCRGGFLGTAVRDRDDGHDRFPAMIILYTEDDNARAILAPFVRSGVTLMIRVFEMASTVSSLSSSIEKLRRRDFIFA